MFDKVKSILDSEFVFTDQVARILALSLSAGKNCIMYGPGGHGKSAMVKSVIDGLDMADETFYQFFGEGMDESRLFGGLNFRKLEDEKVLEYHPERSFLNSRIAVFEELFDAPASVLLALKDVLTARELRNGAQRFPMRTEVIICLTNKEPADISELGPAAHALVERFPLQLDLRWESYNKDSYLAMFEKVAERLGGPVMNGFKAILAQIIAEANESGSFISPRTAVHAYEVCQASAILRGADQVGEEDLSDLRFVDGLEDQAELVQRELRAALERKAAKESLDGFHKEFDSLAEGFDEETVTPIRAIKLAKRLERLTDKMSGFRAPNEIHDEYRKLVSRIETIMEEARQAAFENVRLEEDKEAN
jgi:hypothetical protein